ncbi:MAG: acyltransferase family protein [Rhizobacter sp.]
MSTESHGPAARLEWVDAAKGLGILLMFYGHVVQSLTEVGNENAWTELRFIYSFHMPLFFVLAGFFFRPAERYFQRAQQLAWRRLLPVAFFGLLLVPLWSVGLVRHGVPWWHGIEPYAEGYLRGMPQLNWMTWFLVCLFLCELMALACLPRFKSLGSRLLFATACLWGGVLLCDHISPWAETVGLHLHASFLHEAIVALGFYTAGQALFPCVQRLSRHPAGAALMFVLALGVVLVTYRSNHPGGHFAVMMAGKTHGDVLYFVCTALAGSAAVLALGMLLASQHWLGAIGRNSLPLLGLDGAFFHFFNPQIAALRPPADAPGSVIVYSVAVSVVSLLACIPVVILMNRFVPQLVGQSQRSGPWLPSFEAYLKRRDSLAASATPNPPPAA